MVRCANKLLLSSNYYCFNYFLFIFCFWFTYDIVYNVQLFIYFFLILFRFECERAIVVKQNVKIQLKSELNSIRNAIIIVILCMECSNRTHSNVECDCNMSLEYNESSSYECDFEPVALVNHFTTKKWHIMDCILRNFNKHLI